jgi:hypothetical protein
MMLGSLPVFGIFVWYERRRQYAPLIEAGLFAKRAFSGGLAVITGFFAGMIGFMLVFSLYLQIGLGYTPLNAGLALAPWALGTAIGAALAGAALGPKFGRRVIHAGLLVMMVGLVGVWYTIHHYGATASGWATAPAVLVAGLGMGLVLAPLFNVILSGVEDHEVGSASGVLNAVQQLGSAIGVAVVGTLFFSLLGTQAAAAAQSQVPAVRVALTDAAVPATAQDRVLDTYAACVSDRLRADDPDTTPANCTTVPALVDTQIRTPQAGQRVGTAMTRAGTAAVRADFTDVIGRTTWLVAGLFAMTFLLGFLLPRNARPEQIRG